LTIGVFILASAARDEWWLITLDLVLALVLSLELAARLYAEANRREQLLSFATIADVVVIGSLLLPAFVDNLAFLRVVRALRLLRSYHLLRDLRTASPGFRLYEDVVQRTVNLGVFIFVVTSVVYVTQNDINPGISSYIECPIFHHHHPHHHRLR
jgi:voltage-gated potassium channel